MACGSEPKENCTTFTYHWFVCQYGCVSLVSLSLLEVCTNCLLGGPSQDMKGYFCLFHSKYSGVDCWCPNQITD